MITLKTLIVSTEQEVFDQAVLHLLKQSVKSLKRRPSDPDMTMCAYRGDKGTSCAGGCFIADDEYKSVMEGRSWRGLVEAKQAPSVHSELIQKLQAVHDGFEPCDWPRKLEELAAENNLVFRGYTRIEHGY